MDAERAYSKREEVKNEFAQEYQNHRELTNKFIDEFCEKHDVCTPNDILFDASDMFDF